MVVVHNALVARATVFGLLTPMETPTRLAIAIY